MKETKLIWTVKDIENQLNEFRHELNWSKMPNELFLKTDFYLFWQKQFIEKEELIKIIDAAKYDIAENIESRYFNQCLEKFKQQLSNGDFS